jgi:hypothetical protein
MAYGLQIRIENGDALRSVARAIRDQSDKKLLQKRLRKELRGVGREIVKAEKQAVRALPSKGQSARAGRKPLRRDIARATQLRIRTAGRNAGVAVWINPRTLGPGRANLPGYIEGVRPFQRWRHPTFGHDPWVTQRPHPYFYRTAARHETRVQWAAIQVVNRMAREIESRTT